jgi:hypothetical protein
MSRVGEGGVVSSVPRARGGAVYIGLGTLIIIVLIIVILT